VWSEHLQIHRFDPRLSRIAAQRHAESGAMSRPKNARNGIGPSNWWTTTTISAQMVVIRAQSLFHHIRRCRNVKRLSPCFRRTAVWSSASTTSQLQSSRNDSYEKRFQFERFYYEIFLGRWSAMQQSMQYLNDCCTGRLLLSCSSQFGCKWNH